MDNLVGKDEYFLCHSETEGRGKPEGANEVSMRRSRHFSVDAFGKRVRRAERLGRGLHLRRHWAQE